MKLNISDIQRFCMHDGDGLRTAVFLKGCPLKCKWCHNPETQSGRKQLLFYKTKCISCGDCSVCRQGAHTLGDMHRFDAEKCTACGLCAEVCPTRAIEMVGKTMDINEIVDTVVRDMAFYGENGGVTLSGGEPMMQGDDVLELLKKFKEHGINTAIETCGYFDEKYLYGSVGFADMFLWDIKDTDSERHRRFTGVSNEKIINNLKIADELGFKTVLRCIIVNGVNTDEEHWRNVGAIFKQLKHCEGVELLPYHTYGGSKFEALNGVDNGNPDWIPDESALCRAKDVLGSYGVKLK